MSTEYEISSQILKDLHKIEYQPHNFSALEYNVLRIGLLTFVSDTVFARLGNFDLNFNTGRSNGQILANSFRGNYFSILVTRSKVYDFPLHVYTEDLVLSLETVLSDIVKIMPNLTTKDICNIALCIYLNKMLCYPPADLKGLLLQVSHYFKRVDKYLCMRQHTDMQSRLLEIAPSCTSRSEILTKLYPLRGSDV